MLAIEVRINTHSKLNHAKNINILEKKHGGRIRTCYDLGDENDSEMESPFFQKQPAFTDCQFGLSRRCAKRWRDNGGRH